MAGIVMKKGFTEKARKKAFESIFEKFDHNKNGKIFVRDFAEELKLHNIEIDEEELGMLAKYADTEGEVTKHDFEQYTKESDLWRSLDKNRDGVVTSLEFTSKAELAFKVVDKNNDGYISKSEFQKMAKNLSKEQVDTVMAKFDSNGDGKLDLAEFKKMLKK